MGRGCACDPNKATWDEYVDYEEFLRRLKVGLVKRSRNYDADAQPTIVSSKKKKKRAEERTQQRRGGIRVPLSLEGLDKFA